MNLSETKNLLKKVFIADELKYRLTPLQEDIALLIQSDNSVSGILKTLRLTESQLEYDMKQIGKIIKTMRRRKC